MAQHTAHHHNTTLRDYVTVVRRRRLIVVLAVLVVLGAALGYSFRQGKLYQASAEVLLIRQNLAASLTGAQDPTVYQQSDRIAQTQADVARVPTVARGALRAVRATDRSVSRFLSRSSVTAKPNADLLVFNVTDAEPALAARLATAYAHAFTAYRRQLDTLSIARARAGVQQKIRELERGHEKGSALYGTLVERDQQLATMEALLTSSASVVQEATHATQVQPKPVRNAVLGLLLGLVLGIGLAFLREALDTRVRSADEIGERLGGLSLLGRLPAPPRRLSAKNQLVMLERPTSVEGEAFRILRTNLEFARLANNVRTIMVTSAVEREGKSTTAANLALAFARSGQRVVLVDLDLRRPFLHRFFGMGGVGVTQVALGHAKIDDALIEVRAAPDRIFAGRADRNGVAGRPLLVLPAGATPPDPGAFVGTPKLEQILDELTDRADLVVVDAPPALNVGDVLTLSARVDAILVVTRMNVVRRAMLNEVGRVLASAPAAKLGFVITGAGADRGYGDEFGYGYGYGYGHGSHGSLAYGAAAEAAHK